MIVFEDRIAELVEMLPEIDGFKVNFYWVRNSKDVNAYLMLKTRQYPIIFLISSLENSKDIESEITRDCKWIIASPELETDKLNDARWESSYKNVLNPLASYFLEGLNISSITRIIGNHNLIRIPNYSEAGKNAQIDKWDVIEINTKIAVNGNCLKPIKWQINP